MRDNEYSIRNAEKIKSQYRPGTRIRLIAMEDPYSPVQPGTLGSVRMVDDCGQIHMEWDNGRTLALVPGVDDFVII